ncbi:alpha-2A adrenergic receptor-like [Strongylocentrotus purpuratus]|uniref:G-protein coupled receptors family 1 profile domain-containing protein n=1 Tax=Strongylocentrotus purpuratus TaxID=7668 RepID=A0A7M7RHU2_STRPU|nr:alpha-2A adrenergic receptor-like [Strongylocentrotus purpuratus]
MATIININHSTTTVFSTTPQGHDHGLNVDHNPTSAVILIEGVTLIIIFLGALVTNLIAMVTILRDKVLRRKYHNWLILNLIINDLGVTTTSMLFSVISVFDNGNILVNSDVMCRITGTAAAIFFYGNFSTIFFITIDRYLGVVWSMRFPPSKNRTIGFIFICWVMAILYAMPPLFKLLSDYKFHPDNYHCTPVWEACLFYSICLAVIFGVIVPVMMICYTGVVWTLRRQELLLRSFAKENWSATPNGVSTVSSGKVHIPADNQSDPDTQKETSIDTVIKLSDILVADDHYPSIDTASKTSNSGTLKMQENEDGEKEREKVRKSTRNEKKRKRENPRMTQNNVRANKRVALTGILLVMTIVVCWAPYFIVHSCFIPIDSDHWMGVATMWLSYANSMFDPLIYTCMNRQVRARYRALFSWCPGISCRSVRTGSKTPTPWTSTLRITTPSQPSPRTTTL